MKDGTLLKIAWQVPLSNSMIAIIKPEEDVPMIWRVMAERTYPASAVPWEAEAQWAGRTEGMTRKH